MAGKLRKKADSVKRLLTRFKGKGLRMCRFCGTARGIIRSYGLRICRRCFREVAEQLGFRKF
ncbi:MAG: 30S ribosomal protein S14 [Candidatus Micrarchaeia archaeon]